MHKRTQNDFTTSPTLCYSYATDQSINQSIIYLPEKNNTSRTQRLQNNTNNCPKNPENELHKMFVLESLCY